MKFGKYSSEKANSHYDVIIIGTGISGLCAGALLSMEGKKVLLLEKHFKIGGFTHTFKRENYEWDVGIHYIGGVHLKKTLTRRLFDKISNNTLKWHKMSDNYDRMIFPDKSYDFIAPKETFITNMKSYFPEESEAIDKYIETLEYVNKQMFRYFSAKSLSGIPEYMLYNYLSKNYLKYSNMTTWEALSEITSNNKLKAVLTGQWGDYGLPPKDSSFAMHCAIAYHYLDGANYPVGGSRMFAESIAPVIHDNGGQIFISSGVKRILIKNNKCKGVILENNEEIESDIVISSAGIQNTFSKFLDGYDYLSKYKDNINNLKPSFGYGCLYAGFNKSAKDLNIKDTNLWIYPSYDHDLNTSTYMKNEESPFPLLYISFPSSKDPDWDKNYPSTATLEAIVPTSYNTYNKWSNLPWKNRGDEYEKYKERLSKRIIKEIYKHNPHLDGKISFHELSTPLSTRDMANYQFGELYGMDHNPARFKQKWLKPKTPVKGLFLTGQDITTVGLPSALASGVLTTSTILKKNMYKTI